MDELQRHHAEWKKLDTKEHTLCGFIYVKLMKRQNQYLATEIRKVVALGWEAATDCEGTPGNSQVKEMFTPGILFRMVVTWVCATVKTHQIECPICVLVDRMHKFKKKRRKTYLLWTRKERVLPVYLNWFGINNCLWYNRQYFQTWVCSQHKLFEHTNITKLHLYRNQGPLKFSLAN